MQLIILLVMLPLFSWGLVWALLKLCFIPIKPMKIFGYSWKSPLQKMIEAIPVPALIKQFNNSDQFNLLLPLIEEKLDDFFKNKMSEAIPMIAMFIGEKTIQQLKTVFIKELQLIFPLLIEQYSTQIVQGFQNNIATNYASLLEQMLFKKTAFLRTIAIIVGILWAILMHVILRNF